MAKTISFERVEYVREYYRIEWTEEDYKEFLNWLSRRNDSVGVTRYEVFKDLSFDDIVAIFNDEKDDICYELIYGTEHQYSCTEYVGDFVRDTLREDCWNYGCIDSECEDSDERVEILD